MKLKERSVVFMLILSILIEILPNTVYAGNALSQRQLHSGVHRKIANVEEDNPTLQVEDDSLSEEGQSEGTLPGDDTYDEDKLSEDGTSFRKDYSSMDESSTETEDTISKELLSELESADSEQGNTASEDEENGQKEEVVDADEKETEAGENSYPDSVGAVSPENRDSRVEGETEDGASDETDIQIGNASYDARDSSERYGGTGYVEEETGNDDSLPYVLNEVMEGEAVESEVEEETSVSTQSQKASTGTYYTVTVIGNGGTISSIHDGNEVISVGNVFSASVLVEKGKGILIPNRCVSKFDSSLFLAGWSLSQGGRIVATYNEQYIPTSNCKLYAVWKHKEVKDKRRYGDVDLDGTIGINDILLILRAIAAINNPSTREEHPEWCFKEDAYEQADMTHDGFLDTSDIEIIQRYIAASNNDELSAQHPDWLRQESFYTYELSSLVSSIVLNESFVELESGKTTKLTTTIRPSDAGDKSINWSSNNTNVATVDSYGTVKGMSVGIATIEALAGDGSGVKASCQIKVAKPISSCTITLSPTSNVYDGNEKRPSVTVKDGNNTLRSGTDYYIKCYSNNINAGTAYVEIVGTGYYIGAVKKSFKINKAAVFLSFSKTTVTKLATDGSFTNKLKKRTDGRVSFSSNNTAVANVNSTTGKVTIKGIGKTTITAKASAGNNYKSGSVSFTLTVKKKDLFDCEFSLSKTNYVYTGKELKPVPTVKDNNKTLKNETDFTISYKNNKNAGEATIIITGKGKYTGKITSGFKISKAVPKLTFSSKNISKTIGEKAFTNSLKKETDGVLSFTSSNRKVATVNKKTGKVTINGIGETTITVKAKEGKNYKAGKAVYNLNVYTGIK